MNLGGNRAMPEEIVSVRLGTSRKRGLLRKIIKELNDEETVSSVSGNIVCGVRGKDRITSDLRQEIKRSSRSISGRGLTEPETPAEEELTLPENLVVASPFAHQSRDVQQRKLIVSVAVLTNIPDVRHAR